MSGNYRITEISGDKLRVAYPLVQARYPHLSLDAWLNHARKHVVGNGERRSGVVAIENEQGYIVGLFTYRIGSCLHHGSVLECDNLVAMSLCDKGAISAALLRKIDELAAFKHCGAVRISFHDDDDPMQDAVQSAGLVREGVSYCRPADRL